MTEEQKKKIIDNITSSALPKFFQLVDKLETEVIDICYDGLYETELYLITNNEGYEYISSYSFGKSSDNYDEIRLLSLFMDTSDPENPKIIYKNNNNLFNKWKNYRQNYKLYADKKEVKMTEILKAIKSSITNYENTDELYKYCSSTVDKMNLVCNWWNNSSITSSTTSDIGAIKKMLMTDKDTKQSDYQSKLTSYYQIRTNVNNITYYTYYKAASNYIKSFIEYQKLQNGFYGLMSCYNNIIIDDIIFDLEKYLDNTDIIKTVNSKTKAEEPVINPVTKNDLTYKSLFSDFVNQSLDEDKQKKEENSYNISSVTSLSPWFGYREVKDGKIVKNLVTGKSNYYYDLIKAYCILVINARRNNYINWVNNYLSLCALILGKDNYDKYFNSETGLLAKLSTNSITKEQVQTEVLNMGSDFSTDDYTKDIRIYFNDNSIKSLNNGSVYEDAYEINILSKKLILLDNHVLSNGSDNDSNIAQYQGSYEKSIKRTNLAKQEKLILEFLEFMFEPDTESIEIGADIGNKLEVHLYNINYNLDWGENEQKSIKEFMKDTEAINLFKNQFLKETYINNFDAALENANSYFDNIVTLYKDKKVKNTPIYYNGYNYLCKTYNFITDQSIIEWFQGVPSMPTKKSFSSNINLSKLCGLCDAICYFNEDEEAKNPTSFGSKNQPNYFYYPFKVLLAAQSYSGVNLFINMFNQISTMLTYITTWWTRQVSPWVNKYEYYLSFSNMITCYELCKSSPEKNDTAIKFKDMGIKANYNCVSSDIALTSPEPGYLIIDTLKNSVQQTLGFMLPDDESIMYSTAAEDAANAGGISTDLGGYSSFDPTQEEFRPQNYNNYNQYLSKNEYYTSILRNREGFTSPTIKGLKQVLKERFQQSKRERFSNNKIFITYSKYEIMFELLQSYTGIYQKYISAIIKICSYYGMFFVQYLDCLPTATQYFTRSEDKKSTLDYNRSAFTSAINSFQQFITNTSSMKQTDGSAKIINFTDDWESNKEVIRCLLVIASKLKDYTFDSKSVKPWQEISVNITSQLKAPSTNENTNIGPGASAADSDTDIAKDIEVTSSSLYSILSKCFKLTEKASETDTKFSEYSTTITGDSVYKSIVELKQKLNNTNNSDVNYYQLTEQLSDLEAKLYQTLQKNPLVVRSYSHNGLDSKANNSINDITKYCTVIMFILFMLSNNGNKITTGLYDYTIFESAVRFVDKDAEQYYQIYNDLVSMLYNGSDSNKNNPLDNIVSTIKSISNETIKVDLSKYSNGSSPNTPFNDENVNLKPGLTRRSLIILYAVISNFYFSKANLDNANNYNLYNEYYTLMGSEPESSPFYALSTGAETFKNNSYIKGFNNSFYNKLMNDNDDFRIYSEKSNYGITEYFVSPKTGRKVYTYINNQKQPVNYKAHGVSRESFINFLNKQNSNQQMNKQRPSAIINKQNNKENFVSTGSMGAAYNREMDTITGPALFTDQILRNGQTWKDLHERVDKTGIATDGPGILGGGPGNGYDQAMKSHIKNMEILESANNEFNTPEILKQINKNINNDLGSTPVNSLYNRGNQTKAKIIELQDRAVGVLPERFYPERTKNRNIYKTNEIIPIAGFDVAEARMGEEATKTHSVAYLKRSHGRRLPNATPTGALLEQQFGGVVPPAFSATIGEPQNNREGFASMPTIEENNLDRQFTGVEGGKYWMPKKFVH